MPPGIYNADNGSLSALGSALGGTGSQLNSGWYQGLGGNWIVTTAAYPNIVYTYSDYQNVQTVYPTHANYYANAVMYNVASWPEETAQEKIERRAREEERRQKLAVAESRAEQLLFTMLSDDQVKQYIQHGYFETKVDDRVYRIKKGRAQNVELIENGLPKFRYCAHPLDMTPAPDAMISQLLMLKTNEKKFLEIANRTSLR